MRKILKAIAAVLPLAAFAPAHAQAAEGWRQSCSGPEFVCGSAAQPAKKAVASKSAKTVKSAAAKPAKQAAVASADKPAKTKKKVASATKAKAKVKVADAPAKPKAKAKVADAPAKAKPKAKVAKAAPSSGSIYQSGVASWYGGNFHGRKTANGETYNMNEWTAAHKTLPFGTRVRVTNTRNGEYVDVRINDRGPFIAGRIIDLSRAAAADIGVTSTGVAPVKIAILGKG